MVGHLKRSANTGHLLRNAAGHLVSDCDVCGNCGQSQPSVVVSVSGSCDAECSNVAGTYTFTSYEDHRPQYDYCDWIWNKSGYGIQIWYCIDSEEFCAALTYFGDLVGEGTCEIFRFSGSYPASISCGQSGNLAGSFGLPGFDTVGVADCTGCTANVTLGG